MHLQGCQKTLDNQTMLYKFPLVKPPPHTLYLKRANNKEKNTMKIKESAENYLETILILEKKQGNVRSIDIANELEYSKASVSVAMKQLRENGYINIDKDGHISFTDIGKENAERIFERHNIITKILIHMGVTPHTAADDACRIEHVISEESFNALKSFWSKQKTPWNSNRSQNHKEFPYLIIILSQTYRANLAP